MSDKKLVIVAHGIGNAQPDFYKAWEEILNTNHDAGKFEVKGLHWEDVLQKVEEKYPILDPAIVAMLGLDDLKEKLDDDTYKKISDYLMDVLVYCALDDMCEYIRTECTEKLYRLCSGREDETILIGHSLGAAMLPHITWEEYNKTGAMPYLGMILMASPLGMESPLPHVVADPLAILGKVNGGDRIRTLKRFSSAWGENDNDLLHFLINESDIVCSDVKFDIGDQQIDLIPIRQGFNAEEIAALEFGSPDSVHKFTQGEKTFDRIFPNHAESLYLNRPEFQLAFNKLLEKEVD